MGIQETAQDTLHLVQALAQGKTLEERYRLNSEAGWVPYDPAGGYLTFDTMHYMYRVKTDPHAEWKAAVLDLLDKIYLNRTAAFAAMRDLHDLLDRGPRRK